MGAKRTSDDLDIYVGTVRSFEWFWSSSGEMSGLDDFEEHDDPKILAAKAGKHRFGMFHAGDNIWIVCRYYEKQKQKLDKAGKNAIRLTIEDKKDYEERVSAGEYYERH